MTSNGIAPSFIPQMLIKLLLFARIVLDTRGSVVNKTDRDSHANVVHIPVGKQLSTGNIHVY